MLVDDIRYEYFSMEVDDEFKDEIIEEAGGYCCSKAFCFLTGMYVVAIKDSIYGEIRSGRMLHMGCIFCGTELNMQTGQWVKKDLPRRLP